MTRLIVAQAIAGLFLAVAVMVAAAPPLSTATAAPALQPSGYALEARVVVPDTLVLPGERLAKVRVQLAEPVAFPVNLRLQTQNGSGAYAPAHYAATTQTLFFQPGQTEKVVDVPLLAELRPDWTIRVVVAWSKNYPAVRGAQGVIRAGTARPQTPAARPEPSFPPPRLRQGRTLVFDSRFREPITPDAVKGAWRSRFDWGRVQTGNKELAPYTHAQTDPGVRPHGFDAAGNLVLRAEKRPVSQPVQGGQPLRYDYSAAMITSQNLFEFQYGYIELEAMVPNVQGATCAFWLLPADGGWPPELDIFEANLGDNGDMTTAIHAPRGAGGGGIVAWPIRTHGDGRFHTYGLDWTPDWITLLVDGRIVLRWPNEAYHKRSYIILNTAVGGITSAPREAGEDWKAEMALRSLKVWTGP